MKKPTKKSKEWLAEMTSAGMTRETLGTLASFLDRNAGIKSIEDVILMLIKNNKGGRNEKI